MFECQSVNDFHYSKGQKVMLIWRMKTQRFEKSECFFERFHFVFLNKEKPSKTIDRMELYIC